MTNKTDNELIDAAGMLYLTSDNCSFQKSGDFLSLTMHGEDGQSYKRVNLHKLFPFEKAMNYISVLDSDSNEIGIIESLDAFPPETVELLLSELNRKYYVCKLNSVISVKDRFGFSYWKAISDYGEVIFTIRDAHNSIRKITDGTIQLIDIDNNRYELQPFETLDKKTRRRIELYL